MKLTIDTENFNMMVYMVMEGSEDELIKLVAMLQMAANGVTAALNLRSIDEGYTIDEVRANELPRTVNKVLKAKESILEDLSEDVQEAIRGAFNE